MHTFCGEYFNLFSNQKIITDYKKQIAYFHQRNSDKMKEIEIEMKEHLQSRYLVYLLECANEVMFVFADLLPLPRPADKLHLLAQIIRSEIN